MGSQIFLHSFFVLILKSKGTERHSLVCLSVCLCLLLFLSLITRLTIILGDGNMDDRMHAGSSGMMSRVMMTDGHAED